MEGRRKPKKMKFARLVNWGENEGSTPSSQLEAQGLIRIGGKPQHKEGLEMDIRSKVNSSRIDKETSKMVEKTT